MKNINKRFVAFIAVFSMFFGTILSSVGDFKVYANENDNEKLTIGTIVNEESKKFLENGMELDYKAKKISDDQMKIDIKVNAINEEVNTENLFVDFSFLDYFDILEEKIEVTNPELNNDEFKKSILEKKVVENKETAVINLSSIDKSGTAISFTVKLKDLKDIADKTQLELKAQLKRNEQDKVVLVEELQKIKVEVLRQKEVVIDDTKNTENEVKDETSKEEPSKQPSEGETPSEENPSEDVAQEEATEEDTSNAEDVIENEEDVEIDLESDQDMLDHDDDDDDEILVKKTINPFVVKKVDAKIQEFTITLKVTNKTDKTRTFTVKDYIDIDKFEFVSSNGKIQKNEVKWEKEIKKGKTLQFTYKIKFKDDYEVNKGSYITNPENKKGEASYKDKNEDFENVSINVTESESGGEDSGGGNVTPGTLSGTKSVTQEADENGNYEITFDIKGTAGSTGTKPADIILMIDNSSSMSDKILDVNAAAAKFVDDLSMITGANIRFSVGKFDKNAYIITDSNGSYFSKDISLIKEKILNIKTGSGTNTQDAIEKISLMLNKKRENVNSYVLLFTDGLPFNSNDSGSGVAQHMENAKKEYDKYFASYPVGSGDNKYKDTEFYSVGVISGGKNEGQDPVAFLNSIQNIAKDKTEYEKSYYSSDVSSISTIFQKVTNDIKASINDNLATNAVLSDEIAAEFEYVQGQELKVTTKVNGETIDLTDYTFSGVINNKIEFKFPKIPIGGVKVTFKIKPTNDYFGTYDKDIVASNGVAQTNKSAILETDEFDDISFTSPTVKIPYKKGTIKIIKNITGEALSSNDKFSIGFNGPSKYNVEINGVGQTTLDFYLRDEKTDITNNKHYGLNYMLAGEYTVEELVPMNYSNDVKFEVKVNGAVITGKTFKLDKDNNNIEIKVTNEVANRGFLNDRADVSNEFKYIKSASK